MATYHQQSLSAVLDDLESSAQGLTTTEAKKRLETHGTNELKIGKETPEIVKFLLQFKNFFAFLLIVGGALAMTAERLDPGQGNLYIASRCCGCRLLNAASPISGAPERTDHGQLQEDAALEITASGTAQPGEVPVADLVPGDVIVLHEGDRVPADGRLIAAKELKVDNSQPDRGKRAAASGCGQIGESLAGKPQHGVFRHPWCKAAKARS